MVSFVRTLVVSALASYSACSPLHPSIPSATTQWSSTFLSSSPPYTSVQPIASAVSAESLPTSSITVENIIFASTPPDCSPQTCISTYTKETSPSLPTDLLPDTLSKETVRSLQTLLFVEHIESSFFSLGARNFSDWDTNNALKDTKDIINRIADVSVFIRSGGDLYANAYQQERVHIKTLESLLELYGTKPVTPCNYTFPVLE
jgi:hypothetical protein